MGVFIFRAKVNGAPGGGLDRRGCPRGRDRVPAPQNSAAVPHHRTGSDKAAAGALPPSPVASASLSRHKRPFNTGERIEAAARGVVDFHRPFVARLGRTTPSTLRAKLALSLD